MYERRQAPEADKIDNGRAYIIILVPRGKAALEEASGVGPEVWQGRGGKEIGIVGEGRGEKGREVEGSCTAPTATSPPVNLCR